MPSRRYHSLHHNLEEKNVVFHREHRSKKGKQPLWKLRKGNEFRRKREQLKAQLFIEETKI